MLLALWEYNSDMSAESSSRQQNIQAAIDEVARVAYEGPEEDKTRYQVRISYYDVLSMQRVALHESEYREIHGKIPLYKDGPDSAEHMFRVLTRALSQTATAGRIHLNLTLQEVMSMYDMVGNGRNSGAAETDAELNEITTDEYQFRQAFLNRKEDVNRMNWWEKMKGKVKRSASGAL